MHNSVKSLDIAEIDINEGCPLYVVKNGGTCPQITDLKCPPFTTLRVR